MFNELAKKVTIEMHVRTNYSKADYEHSNNTHVHLELRLFTDSILVLINHVKSIIEESNT